ncbi:glycosyltransferase [Marisediminicola sp. LYQ134]|uniref:glycosyltransferase n=1 Tax=Marisediminicola sp. LYQ134 TaxID=3391061 RepID=UPI003983BE5C
MVTYISPDGAFGGPVTVALAQSAALAKLGHDVTVFAGSPDDEVVESTLHGFVQKLFPARMIASPLGFASMHARGLTRYLSRHATQFDIAHVHMARDLVTLPAAMALQRRGVPTVIQPHGMIDRSSKPLARVLDLFATKRTLSRASTVLSLTGAEDIELHLVAPGSTVSRVSNGVAVLELPSLDGRPEDVLFLARLHPRKRATAFVAMAALLVDDHPATRFSIVGPDEGDQAAVAKKITDSGLTWKVHLEGALAPSQTSDRLRRARVFVLPSTGEVFPMTMLEAFASGTPTVCTDSLGIAEDCKRYGAAIVTDGSPQQLADAVREVLRSPALAESLRKGAYRYLREQLDISAVATSLETTYRSATPGRT